jgi:hypothetical protein
VPERQIETCATHGLRFDASQSSGCVLCQRLNAPPPAAAKASQQIWLWLGGLIVAAVVCAGLMFRSRANRPAPLPAKQAETAQPAHVEPIQPKPAETIQPARGALGAALINPCTNTCSESSEACLAECKRASRDQDSCTGNCMSTLGVCFSSCSAHLTSTPGQPIQVYTRGGAPPWKTLEPALTAVVKTFAQCKPEAVGESVFRIAVSAAMGLPTSAASSAALPDAQSCVNARLMAAAYPRTGGNYVVAARVDARVPGQATPETSDTEATGPGALQAKPVQQVGATPAREVWKPAPPRTLHVSGLASEVIRARGRRSVLVFYDSQCQWCSPFLNGLRPAIRAKRDYVNFLVYSLDLKESEFLSYSRRYASDFNAVWISTPDPNKPYVAEQLSQLRLPQMRRLPYFALLDERGSVVVSGQNYYDLPQLQKALGVQVTQQDVPQEFFQPVAH